MKQLSLSRRDFLKNAAAGAAGVAAIGVLEGCAPKTVTTEANTPVANGVVVDATQTTPQIPSSPVDGKYLTKAVGHENYIYVSTVFAAGKIASCKVISHEETMGIGNFACARIPAAIVEHQSFNVPNLRGSSVSSRAIKNAVKEAVILSGYKEADFSKEVVEETVDKSEEKTVDVVVMGAGTAGLVCAAKLLDEGYSVAVIEKRAIPGGSMAMTYSGVMTPGSATVGNYNIDNSAPEYITSIDGWMGIMGGMVNPEYDIYNMAQPFQRQAYSCLTEASEWFKTIGIGFLTMGAFEGGYQHGTTQYLAPGCYMGGAGYAMMALAQRIEKHPKGEIIYMTKVAELIQDVTTKQVTGLKAVGLKSDDSENGYKLTVNAKVVVLASGGFAKNKEMLAEYFPEHKDFLFNCASESTGDGVLLGLGAGSKMECIGREIPGYLSSSTFFELAFLHITTPGIMVNATGKNVGNIASGNHAKMSEVNLNKDNGGKFFYVFDETSVPSTQFNMTYGFSTYRAMFERGEVLHYTSVEAAANDLSIPDLQTSIDANNKASQAGEPDEFGRKNCPFIDTRNGVNIIKVMPTFYLTNSGICVDPNGHVLTDTYKIDGPNTVIPGLYAAGDVCGSIEEKDGKPYGMGFDMGMGFGYGLAKAIETDGIEKSA